MKLLDRYLLRNLLEPFFLCFFGFLAIWLVFDLGDNGQDFIDAKASLQQVGFFYLTQVPQIVLVSLPVGLLLALVFCLSRMSRSNELISMLAAGISVHRILVPFIGVGIVLTGVLVWLNYSAAPHAEGGKKAALNLITRGKQEKNTVEGYLFRDRQNHRTWFIKRLRQGSLALENVHITQHGPDGDIVTTWYARKATYDPKTHGWALERGVQWDFNEAWAVPRRTDFLNGVQLKPNWTETPWRIASAQLEPQNLSVPELTEYLRFNGDFPEAQLAPYRAYLHHRWAFPFQALIVVIFGAPLAIVFSRRGVVGGVAAAILLYGLLLLTTYLFLALGKGWRIDAITAAWAPNILFFVIGIVLVYYKSSNREWPSFRRKKTLKA